MNFDPTVCSPYPPHDPPVVFDPAWRTETVRLLAEGIEAERAFDRLPILADSLEEAGCDSPDILNHCRLGSKHEWGCWVVTRALGRPQDPRNDIRIRQQQREEDERIRQAVAEINRPRQPYMEPAGWRVVVDRWADRVNFAGGVAFCLIVLGLLVLFAVTAFRMVVLNRW